MNPIPFYDSVADFEMGVEATVQVLLTVAPMVNTHAAGLRAHLLRVQRLQQEGGQGSAAAGDRLGRLRVLAAELQRALAPDPFDVAADAPAMQVQVASAQEQVLGDPHLLGHCIGFLGLAAADSTPPPSLAAVNQAKDELLHTVPLVSRRWLVISRRDALWRPIVAVRLPVAAHWPTLVSTRGDGDDAFFRYAMKYGRTLRTTGPVGTYNELWKGLTLQFEIYDRRDGLVLYSACGFVDIYECDYSASVGLDCDRRETPCRPFSIADREPLGNGQGAPLTSIRDYFTQQPSPLNIRVMAIHQGMNVKLWESGGETTCYADDAVAAMQDVLPAGSFYVYTQDRRLISATNSTGDVQSVDAYITFYVRPAPSSKKRKRDGEGGEQEQEEDATPERERYVLAGADGETPQRSTSFLKIRFPDIDAKKVSRFFSALLKRSVYVRSWIL